MPEAPQILRTPRNADLSVCIPAYRAERFIDRTLNCACGQTYPNLRIIVSVDRSSDETATVCRAFAARDERIEVLVQTDRLGWCENVNLLLSKVDTPYFFLYFHDDLILPQYCERLRGVLLEDAGYASAHSNVAVIGNTKDHTQFASPYGGAIAERLIKLWTSPSRGITYRSLIRSDAFGGSFRLAPDDVHNAARGEDLLMHIMASGPAAALPETLYVRWIRAGGLTDGWKKLSLERLLASWSREFGRHCARIDELVPSLPDNRLLKFGLMVFLLNKLKDYYRNADERLPAPGELHPAFVDFDFPEELEKFGPEVVTSLRSTHLALCQLYGSRHASER